MEAVNLQKTANSACLPEKDLLEKIREIIALKNKISDSILVEYIAYLGKIRPLYEKDKQIPAKMRREHLTGLCAWIVFQLNEQKKFDKKLPEIESMKMLFDHITQGSSADPKKEAKHQIFFTNFLNTLTVRFNESSPLSLPDVKPWSMSAPSVSNFSLMSQASKHDMEVAAEEAKVKKEEEPANQTKNSWCGLM